MKVHMKGLACSVSVRGGRESDNRTEVTCASCHRALVDRDKNRAERDARLTWERLHPNTKGRRENLRRGRVRGGKRAD